jgi:tetratricopeptide (TPR) repeat protein
MKKRSRRNGTSQPGMAPTPAKHAWPRRGVLITGAVVALLGGVLGGWWWRHSTQSAASDIYRPRPRGALTFNKNIAPILFQRCAMCHRPGQSGPFPLLTYEDARRRAKQIAEVTASRFMPPWLPEAGHGEFAESRRLSADEIGVIQQWAAEGAPEGNAADRPALPQWPEGWQLGQPDLVVQMPEPYLLAAEGRDVYRNVVLPIPVDRARYVEAVEFRPGNPRVVHHAAMRIDRTRFSRLRDEREAGVGFGGMSLTVTTELPAGGHFLNWQPGKLPYRCPPGLAWTLATNTDLVVQLHLNPSGKPEPVQCAVGFYFTDQPPTREAFKLILDNVAIDIPPDQRDYAITDSYVLPVDVEALAIFPHAHYLAREMRVDAALPGGGHRWLLYIREWDFNWQGDYRFARPVFLPRGTTVNMRFTYDNSADNVRNPNQPPKRVVFGMETTDEMGEVWLQLLPRNRADIATLQKDYREWTLRKAVQQYEQRVRRNPDDGKAHLQLGKAHLGRGNAAAALAHFRSALRLRPTDDEPHYYLGVIHRTSGRLREARAAFENALWLNAENYMAHGNLGLISFTQGRLDEAEAHFRSALRINPDDTIAQTTLTEVLQARQQRR